MHIKVDPSPSFCFRYKKYIYKHFKPEKSVIDNLMYAFKKKLHFELLCI